ncbi:hypothetical protein NLI96_g8875 [Meripilus lineatus]|uniref:Uncharacterized protein n=1 Tax=Meripilus lineatus TaxID=2056292 RepID=A0AAD5V1R0_9APHY|nr:hypothetical protein NLI96_g8875 [Physisporinus lineatus]
MESILCEFKELRKLQLDNLEIAGGDDKFDLPKLRKHIFKTKAQETSTRPVPTLEGTPIILRNWSKEDCTSLELCCVQIKHLTAESRFLLSSSLTKLMDELINRRLHKEAERGREGLLQVQRELALVDKVQYAPFVNNTLNSMFQVQLQVKNYGGLRDDEEIFYSINVEHLWSRMTRTLPGPTHDNPSYASHFLTTPTGPASSPNKLNDREIAINGWLQVVNVCVQLAHRFYIEIDKGSSSHTSINAVDRSTYISQLADAIHNLALPSPPQLIPSPPSTQGNNVLESRLERLSHVIGPLPRSFAAPDLQTPAFTIIQYQNATVDVWRVLAERYPMVFISRLAKVLKEIVSDHRPREGDASEYGGPEDYRKEFTDHRLKMMGVWRWVVKQDVFTYAPSLADALDISASDCFQIQQHTEAIRFRREAVGIWRKLTQRDRSYGRSLETSLHHLALDLSQLQGSIDGIRYEAIAVCQELLGRNASTYVGDFVRALSKSGRCLSQRGYHRQALVFYSKAAEAWRSHTYLSCDFDSSILSYLRCLHSMSGCLISLNSSAEAVPLLYECVSGFRKYQKNWELCICLNTLSIVLAEANYFEQAIAASRESLHRLRLLVNTNFDQYYPELAPLLHNLSSLLHPMGQHDQALGAVEEALTIYRTLTSNKPSKYDQILAVTLRRYALILEQVGRSDEATKANDEASEIERVLVPVNEVTGLVLDIASQVSETERTDCSLPADSHL